MEEAREGEGEEVENRWRNRGRKLQLPSEIAKITILTIIIKTECLIYFTN